MSWYQLLDILGVNRDLTADAITRPPEACPYGGFPLEAGPDGSLHCPEGDYTWPEGMTSQC